MRSTIASSDFAAIATIVRNHAALIRAGLARAGIPKLAPAFALALPLALAAAGCASPRAPEAHPQLVIAPSVAAPTDGDWWKTAGDPLLANLIERGIAADNDLACRASRIHEQEEADAASTRGLTGKVRKLVSGDPAAERDAARMAWAYAYAQARADRAAEIAVAYVQVRRLQQVLVLRTQRLDQFRDNAVIAEFRRQAGLVNAIDGGLGDSMAGVADADLSATRARFDAARGKLAAMTGMDDAELLTALGDKPEVPVFARDGAETPAAESPAAEAPLHRADLLALRSRLEASLAHDKVTQADLDAARADPADVAVLPALRDALQKLDKAEAGARAEIAAQRQIVAAFDAREKALEETAGRSRRAVSDARSAYRAGFGDFATLYVAEAAALAAEEARVGLRADRAEAVIRLRKLEGAGWSAADLDPPAGGTACD